MALIGVNVNSAGDSNPEPKKTKKGGSKELAEALGISEEKLKAMKPHDVETLARKKGVDLDKYEKPKPPQGPDMMSMNGSLFGVRNDLG